MSQQAAYAEAYVCALTCVRACVRVCVFWCKTHTKFCRVKLVAYVPAEKFASCGLVCKVSGLVQVKVVLGGLLYPQKHL